MKAFHAYEDSHDTSSFKYEVASVNSKWRASRF